MNVFETQIRDAERVYEKLWKKLDQQARRDRCAGDIFVGWDWPTLRAVMPTEYAILRDCIRLCKEADQALRTTGCHSSQSK
jgi:hypothetical protein